jgi:hypothetical protein
MNKQLSPSLCSPVFQLFSELSSPSFSIFRLTDPIHGPLPPSLSGAFQRLLQPIQLLLEFAQFGPLRPQLVFCFHHVGL